MDECNLEGELGAESISVLVCDPHRDGGLQSCFRGAGWRARVVEDIGLVAAALDEEPFALIVAELVPVDIHSRVVVGDLSALGVPLIVVTDDESVADVLEWGATDGVRRPISKRELTARARLRVKGSPVVAGPIRRGRLSLDSGVGGAHLDGRDLGLAPMEFRLLMTLVAAEGRPVSREQLLREVWGSCPQWQDPATVTEHVHRLRTKLEDDPHQPRWILTVRSHGYRFVDPQS
ncbi:MAG: response regulator transcription factor [Acidimicrobiia bacterium]|nr:response regulator transcription factor [Acidimicrobiia bacterium]